MFRNKDIKYIESVLRAISYKCKTHDRCRFCALTGFCADRPYTGITSDDFYRNMCSTFIPVIENNGITHVVDLEVFLEYLHTICTKERDTKGCGACVLKEHCKNTFCFTVTPCLWNI